ncbi:MAG: ribosome silencing factor [Bacteroidetes bacterium]|nr:ribosome silencing factor [Bacteroidota bacterium]
MKSTALAKKISQLILDKKGEDVKILDIRNLTNISDYFVIASASSDTQVKAIADHISKETKKIDEKPWHNEGMSNMNWVLLDFVDVVVHIFLTESRKFYNLEGLWADAEVTEVKDEPKPVRKTSKKADADVTEVDETTSDKPVKAKRKSKKSEVADEEVNEDAE